jgi:hypothetical protein
MDPTTEQMALDNLNAARQEYARVMDHIAKYARADSDDVSGGGFPDQFAAANLALGIAAFNKCVGADAILTAVRSSIQRGGDVPIPGQIIYVGSSMYIEHGQDDFHGGMATVSEVFTGISAGRPTPFVRIKERPQGGYNWHILRDEQAALQRLFGLRQAHQCPEGAICPWDDAGERSGV